MKPVVVSCLSNRNLQFMAFLKVPIRLISRFEICGLCVDGKLSPLLNNLPAFARNNEDSEWNNSDLLQAFLYRQILHWVVARQCKKEELLRYIQRKAVNSWMAAVNSMDAHSEL
jgi:hypothetical protein